MLLGKTFSTLSTIFVDINECAGDIDDCDQICTNTNGSFQCSCNSGYNLSSDERSCLEERTEVTTRINQGRLKTVSSLDTIDSQQCI